MNAEIGTTIGAAVAVIFTLRVFINQAKAELKQHVTELLWERVKH